MKSKLISALCAVLCIGMLAGCDLAASSGSAETTASKTDEVVGGTLEKPAPVTGEGKETLNWDELYKDMTPEEIAEFEKDLADLGWTKEDLENLLGYGEDDE